MMRVGFAAENQVTMAENKGLEMIIRLLSSTSTHVQRQAAKALANLGVNTDNKRKIAEANGIDPLVALVRCDARGVQIEAVAAIANLAVNGTYYLILCPFWVCQILVESFCMPVFSFAEENEVEIAEKGMIHDLLQLVETEDAELQSQCTRALRNLCVNGTSSFHPKVLSVYIFGRFTMVCLPGRYRGQQRDRQEVWRGRNSQETTKLRQEASCSASKTSVTTFRRI